MKNNQGVPKCILIADDLAGACDTGVQFVRRGLSCEVSLAPEGRAAALGSDVAAFNTDSRSNSPTVSQRKIEEIARECSGLDPQVLFKKIDSTLRGNVGAEIAAALAGFRMECAIVAPAIPAMRRIVRGGMLEWTDCTGTSRIDMQGRLEYQGFPRNRTVSAKASDCQEEKFVSFLSASIAKGTKLIVADCASQEELRMLVAAAGCSPHKILWAGAAGLGMALAERMGKSESQGIPQPAGSGSVVFCIGSTHPETARQREKLLSESDALELSPKVSCIEMAREAIEKKRHLILTIHREQDWDESLATFFAGLRGAPVSGMVLTGGDTALLVCKALGAFAIQLQDEMVLGFPWGNIRGGIFDGLPVATKSGGFGEPDALRRSAEFFGGCREVFQ